MSQQVRKQLYRFSNLEALQHLTFEKFQPRGPVGLTPQQAQSVEKAFNICRHFSGTLQGWLLLLGGAGCGKTHLAAATANFAVGVGVPTLFLTVPDLLDWLRFSYDSPETTFEARFEEIRNITLLVMDDFGTQNATPWAQEKLFQIINHRYINHLPTVITSNLAMEEIEERIRSRLSDFELVQKVYIQAPDFRHPGEMTGNPELSSLGLHRQRTFASFSQRENEGMIPEEQKSLERAFRTAQKYAEKPKGWLVLTGTYGCGKTHLAAAIGNYRTDLGDPVMFVVVPDLLDHLRSTFAPSSSASYDQRFEEVRSAHLLILDDLGSQSTTPWAREKLFQLLNYRYNAELSTVITTSEQIENMDARIRSRMLDTRLCKVLAILAPGYRGADGAHRPKTLTRRLARS